LRWRVRRLTGEPLRGCFVLDKVLHNHLVAPAILDRPDVRAVILLRQPVEVLQSIVHMGTHLHPSEHYANVMHAARYYVERVKRLTQIARQTGTRGAFIESEALMSNTDDVLDFLREFLGLDAPLERRYRSFSRTGQPGFGDPSAAICSGEIGVRRETKPRYSIPPSFIAEAVEAHAECLAACRYHCVLVPDGESRQLSKRAAREVALPGVAVPGPSHEERERTST